MSTTKKIVWLIVILFVGIQFIQPARNQNGQVLPTDIHNIVAIPKNVETVLQKGCYDCHSNNTVYPWYMNIQPAGWLMAYHVKNGKKELNFSEFGSYSVRRQQSKLKSVASQVKDGEMPLSSYTLIHRNAILSKEEKALISNWANEAQSSINAKK